MDRIKARFKEDPYFATAAVIVSVIVLTRFVAASAQLIESTAYARATRLI